MPTEFENAACPECGATWDGDTDNCHVCGASMGFHSEDEYPEGGEEEAPCEMCGAPLGQPHEPGCPNEDDVGSDPDRYREAKEPAVTEFDKFMDRTLIEERQRTRINAPENNPRRLQAARYQDRPNNKTRFVRGR
jgi:hypothetical protein